MPMKRVIRQAGMKLGFWKLEVEVRGIVTYGMLNQSEQPTQSGHFSHLDPLYQQ
jgi:hypothetical protein